MLHTITIPLDAIFIQTFMTLAVILFGRGTTAYLIPVDVIPRLSAGCPVQVNHFMLASTWRCKNPFPHLL